MRAYSLSNLLSIFSYRGASHTPPIPKLKPGDLVVQQVHEGLNYYRVIDPSEYGQKFDGHKPELEAAIKGDWVCLHSLEDNAYTIKPATWVHKIERENVEAEKQRVAEHFNPKIDTLTKGKERILSALEAYASSEG